MYTYAVERLFLAAFGLIALYVFFNASQASNVIGQIGQYTGGIFGTLQGAEVKFPQVQINRPANFGAY